MKTQIIQDAEDNWPEDEARLLADSFASLSADYPEESADNEKKLRADAARMETFFARELDADNLTARFRRHLASLTNLTF